MESGYYVTGQIVMGLGFAIMVAGGIWCYVNIFRYSIGWGFACLLVPFAGLAFLFKHGKVIERPFRISLAGFGVLFVGMLLWSLA